MKKRYCDFCKSEIEQSKSFIKLLKVEYKTKSYKTYNGIKRYHQIYPQKVIADLCIKCYEKMK